jgi:RNA polymerase sigma factor (sigma-70 family)
VVTTAATGPTTEAVTARQILSPEPGRLDPEAAGAYIGRLFAEQGRMVLGLSRLLLRDPLEAEDAAQQVFLSAHQAVLRGSLPRDPPAWIAAITRNECRARVRARIREPLSLPELPSDLPDPLAAAIRAADLQAVWAALAALPRRQRRALVLREVGGLSYRELGRALGVSHSAVESLLFRARQQAHAFLVGANTRLAALPVALKVAGATISVGIVATGASDLHPIRMPVVVAHPRGFEQRVASRPAFHLSPIVVERRAPSPVVHVRHRRDEIEHAAHDVQAAEAKGTAKPVEVDAEQAIAEPVEQHVEQASGGPGPAPAEAVQLEATHEGPGDGVTELETGHSGPDGTDGSSGSDSGSDHSGPG